MKTSDLFVDNPIVPVVTIENPSLAVPLARSLVAAGIRAIEITLRTDLALEAMESVAKQVPQILLGAGSIRLPKHFQQALDAGAKFCVSPGFNNVLLEEAAKLNTAFIPGASTAAEMLHLYQHGYDFIKFFPAQISGGVSMLKALSAPLPEIKFFPTGGITAALALDYLALNCVVCLGGSWFVPGERIDAGDFVWLESEAAKAMAMVSALTDGTCK